jgi:hypothetical protein
MLDKAKKALKLIKKEHIDELRMLGKPPKTIRIVFEAACIMCGKTCLRLPDKENPKQMVDDWWATSQKWMSNSNKFMADITTNFNAKKIPESVI